MKFRRPTLLLPALAVFAALLLMAQAKLPSDFPKDVPIYPGATVRQAGATAKEMVILETPDPKEKALSFYKLELPKNGWKMEKPFSGSGDALQGIKGDRMVSMGVVRQQKTLIQIGFLSLK
ncbi:MAG: hypothetical protein U0Q18_21525 [Bryobacteraceae bacterium]